MTKQETWKVGQTGNKVKLRRPRDQAGAEDGGCGAVSPADGPPGVSPDVPVPAMVPVCVHADSASTAYAELTRWASSLFVHTYAARVAFFFFIRFSNSNILNKEFLTLSPALDFSFAYISFLSTFSI